MLDGWCPVLLRPAHDRPGRSSMASPADRSRRRFSRFRSMADRSRRDRFHCQDKLRRTLRSFLGRILSVDLRSEVRHALLQQRELGIRISCAWEVGGRTFLAERFPLPRPSWRAHQYDDERSLVRAHPRSLEAKSDFQAGTRHRDHHVRGSPNGSAGAHDQDWESGLVADSGIQTPQ